MSTHDKTAIVTGAGTGIGKGVATALLNEGYRVAFAGRRKEPLEQAIAAAGASAKNAIAVPTDVSDPASVRALFARTKETFGRLDLLFNNAGVGAPGVNLEDLSFEQWKTVVDINLTGAFLFAQAAGRDMLKRQWGRIINTASIAGMHASVHGPHYAPYAATKAGLIGLTRELAVSWARQGIRVNAIAPGFFHSRLADGAIATNEASIKASSPIPRVGNAGELKGVAVFLAADASNYITGQTIIVDGGRTIA